ncbi:MAG: hypothetical protein MUC94_17295 [bacterium]|jgi:hypothetical protein|nr:hypothetical protein [bacterium]
MSSKEKNTSKNEEDTFINFHYQEIKELCKHFLTLVSGILVVTLAFSEKIIDFETAAPKLRYLLAISWASFILSIIFNGIGLVYIFWAGDCANDSVFLKSGKDYKNLAKRSYIWLGIAGALLVMGLLCLGFLLFVKLMS